MDDKTFDVAEARQWIEGIEASKSSIRDQDIYPTIIKWIQENDLKNILDIGCGQGMCSEKIDLASRSYTGVEPSGLMAQRARELYQNSNRNFVDGNIYALPFRNQNFDGAFSILVWHLLSDLETAATELSRVLIAGGKFLIITANPKSYATWKSFYKDMSLDGKRLHGTMRLSDGTQSKDTLYLHTETEILDSLKMKYLNVLRKETFRTSPTGDHIFICFSGEKATDR